VTLWFFAILFVVVVLFLVCIFWPGEAH